MSGVKLSPPKFRGYGLTVHLDVAGERLPQFLWDNVGEGKCESTIVSRQWGDNFGRGTSRCLAGPSGKLWPYVASPISGILIYNRLWSSSLCSPPWPYVQRGGGHDWFQSGGKSQNPLQQRLSLWNRSPKNLSRWFLTSKGYFLFRVILK